VIAAQDIPVGKTAGTGGSWNQGGNTLKSLKSLGTISNNDFVFNTNNNEVMRLTSSGFLGIATNNPLGGLHFVNENSDAGNDYIFDDYANGANIIAGIFLKKSRGTFALPQNLQSGDTIGQFRFSGRNSGSIVYNSGSGIDATYLGSGTTNLTDLGLFSSDTERIRINENGKVGIGTSSFDGTNPEKLIVDAGVTSSYNVISGRGDIDNYLQLNIQNKSNGTSASSDIIATANNGTESVNFIDMGINSSTYSNASLPILASINQAYLYSTGADFVIGDGTVGRDLIFFTNGYALTNERMRITASGNVGINTNSPTEKLTVGGIIAPSADNLYTLGTSTARWSEVWATNGAIQTSDVRLKTNIQPLEYGVSEVLKMSPVQYKWKDNPESGVQLGLIAQRIQKTIPEVVTGDAKKEKLGMNYAELVPVLINSIKEQQVKLQALKLELEMLKKNSK
jgi:hypothetical protein